MNPHITHHAAVRYLQRKCGVRQDSITPELVNKAKSELEKYFKGSEEIPYVAPGGAKVYADNSRGLRFWIRGRNMITVTTEDYTLSKKHKDSYVNRRR